MQAQTSTGDVRLAFATLPGTVHARTSTGDIQVQVPDDGTAYQVDTSTSVGSTHVAVATTPTSSHRLELVASVGDITVTVQQS